MIRWAHKDSRKGSEEDTEDAAKNLMWGHKMLPLSEVYHK